MGKFEVLSRLAVLIAVLAGICLHPALQEHRSKLYKLLTTKCPLHWFDDILKSESENDKMKTLVKSGIGGVILTKEDLASYTGNEGSKGLYIAILGLVYDVSAGERFYGPGNGYGFFAGIDGTRAFVTGEFNEKGLIDDVTGFSSSQMSELLKWVDFYEKTYIYVGKLVGNFYSSDGTPTEALLDAQRALEVALDEERLKGEQAQIFPPCNSQWTDTTGTMVWCSNKSGGIERSWVGFPRKFFDPQTQIARCVCVRSSGAPSDWSKYNSKDGIVTGTSNDRGDLDHPSLREYDNCHSTSESCALS